jgi:hypothetical protein
MNKIMISTLLFNVTVGFTLPLYAMDTMVNLAHYVEKRLNPRSYVCDPTNRQLYEEALNTIKNKSTDQIRSHSSFGETFHKKLLDRSYYSSSLIITYILQGNVAGLDDILHMNWPVIPPLYRLIALKALKDATLEQKKFTEEKNFLLMMAQESPINQQLETLPFLFEQAQLNNNITNVVGQLSPECRQQLLNALFEQHQVKHQNCLAQGIPIQKSKNKKSSSTGESLAQSAPTPSPVALIDKTPNLPEERQCHSLGEQGNNNQ